MTARRQPGVPQSGFGSRRARTRRTPYLAMACAALTAVALAACGSSSSGSTTSGSATSGKLSGKVVVFAATSLTAAFDKIGAQFQAANPGVTVTFNYNGSSSLATSITQGAPADVFASAAPA